MHGQTDLEWSSALCHPEFFVDTAENRPCKVAPEQIFAPGARTSFGSKTKEAAGWQRSWLSQTHGLRPRWRACAHEVRNARDEHCLASARQLVSGTEADGNDVAAEVGELLPGGNVLLGGGGHVSVENGDTRDQGVK